MRLLKITGCLFLLSLALFGCKKEFEGDRTDLGIPETYMMVDSIYRSGDTRYTTTVEAHWWASITTGFIKGYEVSTDNMQTWSYTTKQSGTFLLTLPSGSDTANIRIYVRAISSTGNVDPTPAGTTFPVRNTPPAISLDFSTGQRASAFPAYRFNWVLSDIDGLADIDHVDVGLNDTVINTLQLSSSVTGASFIGERNNGTFTGKYFVYANNQTNPLSTKLAGGLMNDTNRIYLRAVDRSGSRSAWVVAKIYVRTPQSGILFINDYNSNKNAVTNFYSNRLNNLGAPYNTYDVVRSLVDEFPADAFTTTKTFEFFNRIVWATEDPTRSLGTAQTATIPFFNNGGKIFMVAEIPNDVALDASFFSFTPIEKLVDNPGRSFRMATGDQVYGYNDWPVLKATGIITYPRPFFTYTTSSGLFTYDSLARADLKSFGPGGAPAWTGPSNVMSKRINTQRGKPDFVTMTVPMHLLNGNNNVDSFFKKVVINELEF